jgi:hypothetical protein
MFCPIRRGKMRARAILIAASLMPLTALSGCITERAVLTNAQGQTVTCETKGHVGIVSPIRVQAKQHDCVKKAEESGYKVTASPAPAS